MSEMVQFSSNGKATSGYLAVPQQVRAPGVILIQEWWGLVDHIKGVADRLAGEGFVALAPDLYHGEETAEPDEAQKMMMALNTERCARDMTGAVDYLLGHPAVQGDTLGAVGFCMGGGLVLWLSTLRPEIGAAVPFYGVIPWDQVQPDYSQARAAYQGHFGEDDASNPPEEVRKLEDHLRALGKEVDFYFYPGADHAFFNDTRPEVYDEQAATRAWERTVSFLRDHLV
ncbi:MAG: dienelactone hydrolase family protein [Actinomycetota bacterium]|nr:dienelactone hydrolase family protein [Actinomycetota bacterium]